MINAELAKKNLLKGLWSVEMVDALAVKGKVTAAETTAMKSELTAKLAKEESVKAIK